MTILIVSNFEFGSLSHRLTRWPSKTLFIVNYSVSMKQNWKHVNTFLMAIYYYSIYTSILPSADVFTAWLFSQKNHQSMLCECFNTFPANEGNNWRMFLFANIQITGWISGFMAENLSSQYLYRVSLESVYMFKVKVGLFSLMPRTFRILCLQRQRTTLSRPCKENCQPCLLQQQVHGGNLKKEIKNYVIEKPHGPGRSEWPEVTPQQPFITSCLTYSFTYTIPCKWWRRKLSKLVRVLAEGQLDLTSQAKLTDRNTFIYKHTASWIAIPAVEDYKTLAVPLPPFGKSALNTRQTSIGSLSREASFFSHTIQSFLLWEW